MSGRITSPVTIRNEFSKQKAYAQVDWEGPKDKYKNICETFASNLLKRTGSEECADSADFFTRESITSKKKQIRVKYRKVVDAAKLGKMKTQYEKLTACCFTNK